MWAFHDSVDDEYANIQKGNEGFVFFGVEPSGTQGVVMADALNVHETTGLTPTQLQARVAELEAAVEAAVLAERAECAAMAEAFKVHGYDYTGNFELHEAIRDRKNLGFGA